MELLLLLILIIVALSIVLTAYAGWIGAPFVPTPKHTIENILKEAGLSEGEIFYDFGSGTGRILIVADKEFGAKSIGYELSPFFYLISRMNIFLSGSKNSKVFFKNFYNQNFNDANIIFVFLTPYAVNKLKSKFENELKKGARVISYAFEVKGWTPLKIIRKENIPPVFIYKIS